MTKARLFSRFSVLLFIACFATSSPAAVWVSQEFKCKITIPSESGWLRSKPPTDAIKLVVGSPDHTKQLSVLVTPISKGSPEDYVEAVRKKFSEKSIGKGTSEERITVDGHDGYRLHNIWMLGGKELHRADTLVIVDNVIYQVSATAFGSDPMSDPVLKESVESFRFLNTSASSRSGAAQAGHKKATSRARYGLPEMMADITFVTLVVIVVGYVVVRILKKPTTRP